MFPSSVRRAVAAVPQAPAVSTISLASAAPRAAAAAAYGRPAQRRYSSSKPSSPNDGPRDFAARSSVPASSSSKAAGEKRKRKVKDAAPAVAQLPSVPSTRHIKDESFALSTFFALHRPISVTRLLPEPVTDDAFAEIFNPQPRSHRVGDVLATLSQTVQGLTQLSLGDAGKQDAGNGSSHHRMTYKHADGTEADLVFEPGSMASQFLPFTPPPAPRPMTDADVADEMAAAAAEEQHQHTEEPQTRVYRAIVTIEETVDADGQYKVMAHSPELVDESAPRSFLERMAQRQLRFDDARVARLQSPTAGKTMHAISVKRQRKLKMKKKKYKKLMRKTRNERRKLDRL